MADKPVAEVVDVDAAIDALAPSPTSSDVYEATLPFNPHAVAASAVRRASGGGGGASFPDAWTVAEDGTFTIADPYGDFWIFDTYNAFFHYVDDQGAIIATLSTGSISLGGSTYIPPQLGIGPNFVEVHLPAGKSFKVSVPSAPDLLQLLASAAVIIHANSAPADGDLVAGDMALWLDQTNGAAKMMIKAKSADGTVVTGNVPLA